MKSTTDPGRGSGPGGKRPAAGSPAGRIASASAFRPPTAPDRHRGQISNIFT